MVRTFATFVFLGDDNVCNGMMARTGLRTHGHDSAIGHGMFPYKTRK